MSVFYPFGIPSTSSLAITASIAEDLLIKPENIDYALIAGTGPTGPQGITVTECPEGFFNAFEGYNENQTFPPVPSSTLDRSSYLLCVPIPSPTPTPTPSPTRTPSISITPSVTSTPSISVTPTRTPSISITPSITSTPSISITPTISVTPSISVTPTRTPTISITPSVTRTPIVSVSPTRTPTISVTPTVSITPSISITPTISITPSVTSCTCTFIGSLCYSTTADGAGVACVCGRGTQQIWGCGSRRFTASNCSTASPFTGFLVVSGIWQQYDSTGTPIVGNTGVCPSPTPSITRTPSISVTPSITRTPSISVTPTRTRTPPISVTPTRTRTPSISVTPTPSSAPSGLCYQVNNTSTNVFDSFTFSWGVVGGGNASDTLFGGETAFVCSTNVPSCTGGDCGFFSVNTLNNPCTDVCLDKNCLCAY